MYYSNLAIVAAFAAVSSLPTASTTVAPTASPTVPSSSYKPTSDYSFNPTSGDSAYPTDSHSTAPTAIPSTVPTVNTAEPTRSPTVTPSSMPSYVTAVPTPTHSTMPSYGPTVKPKNVCKKKDVEDDCEGLGCLWKSTNKGGKCNECKKANNINKKCIKGGCVWDQESRKCHSCNEAGTSGYCTSQSCVWKSDICLSCRAGSPSESECKGYGCAWKKNECVSCRECGKRKNCTKFGCEWDGDEKVCNSSTR